ncbi:uncharacterized protein LOC124532620 isoform X2 [Vanessa cardui]|uniref:uncharacterized protein LOC124532620 isoform X1 n=1 Tax=Vanessa cardui TaxID=171605 RepID=UPI001F136913|nr:uncharacterized protein LOC124532620 isoform X1 [Vanessa cardui]XP_046963564.1 uncharacterized protein LOC124532620 isoform X2 [Vanessa cardui]
MRLWDMWGVLWTVEALAQLVGVVATPLDPAPLTLRGLSPFVRHWQPADYEPVTRHRRRRSLPLPPPTTTLRLFFTAHNKEFRLVLQPDPSSVFAEGVQFHSSAGPIDYNTAHVYSGKLEDDDSSHVYGVITADGLFDGTIWTSSEEYYIEPLSRYNIDHPSMHSVIYRRSDVEHPYANSDVTHCASHLLHVKGKLGYQGELLNFTDQVTVKEVPFNNNSEDLHSEINRRKKRWLPEDEMQDDEPKKNPELPLDLDVPYTSNSDPFDKFSTRKPKTKIDKSNLITKVRLDSEESRPKPKTHVEVIKTKAGVVTVSKDIVKKEPVGYTILSANASDDGRHVNKRATVDPRKTTCLVYLQADHMFYQRYGSEEACIEVMTRHVQKVNAIYKVTDFNQDGKPDNITFMIKRIKVHTLDALKDPAYRFPNNYGVEKYLELFSEEDYDAFCLAYMFTYRDFEMGTLGLAWTGDLKNAGGVCEKNGHYRGSMKSLNTGIVTLLNYGKHVPPAVSHVTLAHEIGHNFGSPHDPEMCTPFGEDGNYIMFARATSGDRKNNNKFSPCSLRAIDPVLNNKARSPKGCFTEPQPAICGNGVVEEGEECDCGWASECTDVCCRPQAVRPHYKPCTLTEHSVCSPSQGPCCTASCTLKFGDKCRSDNGCRDAAHCDGKRAACPASRHKPNRTRCDKELVCFMGECTGSICLAYGLESCQCAPRKDDPRSACELCCRKPGGACVSSFHWNTAPFDVPDMYAKPGTPCNDYNGYCDVFQRCREVDPSGPLATLRKLLLSDESIAGFKRWVLRHWYAVLLILLAVIALLVASTRFFGRHAKKIKSVTIIHSSTTETVRLPDAADQGLIVHTAVRSKLPLKKKVALRTRAYRNKKDTKQGDKASPSHNLKKRKPVSQPKLDEPHKVAKESTAVVTNTEGKSPKHVILSKHKNKVKKRKVKVKKETIDYSSLQKHSASTPPKDTEALTKVQKWLLSSPQPTVIPKSKSIPLGLTERTHRPAPKGTRKTRPSKSASNLLSGEKTRLQVVFKPPFRFSVKICKSDKTKVVLDKSSKPDVDRKQLDVLPQLTCPVDGAKHSSKTPKHSQSVSNIDNNSLPKTEQANQESGSHGYENLLPRSASDCKLGKKIPDLKVRTGHKKSNSVGQKRETTESRQNLISHEDFDNTHVYENVLATQDSFVPKSCSMPRRQTTGGISRQSSYGHLPRAQIRPQRHSTNNINRSRNNSTNESEHFYNIIETLRRDNSGTANTCRTNTSSSSGSSREGVAKISSKSSRQNSLIDKPARSSLTSAPSSSKSLRQLGDVELEKSQPIDNNSRGFQLVVGKDRLKRQLSDNELSRSRLQLAMPMSAGAEPRQAFCWAAPARARARQRATYTFGELKDSAPSSADAAAAEGVHISPEDFLKIIDN